MTNKRQPPWFAGRYTQPNIPTPEKKEHHEEQLVQPIIPHDTRPHIIRPAKEIHEPHFNELYDSLRTKQAWRYAADLSVHGTTTLTPGTLALTAVNLPQPPNYLLQQWPRGTQLYLVIRSFGIVPREATPLAPSQINVPATAGNLTITTGQGILIGVLVTATGTANLLFSDGAAGNVIGFIPSSATLGQFFSFGMPFGSSLVAQKTASTPVCTVGYQGIAQASPPFIDIGALECAFIDNAGNITYLAEFRGSVGGNIGVDTLIVNPITDTGTTTIGTLQLNAPVGQNNQIYLWSFGLSTAYLLPAKEPYSEHLYRDIDH